LHNLTLTGLARPASPVILQKAKVKAQKHSLRADLCFLSDIQIQEVSA